jgi:stage III sporulation protein AA
MHTDVLSRCPKHIGINAVLRSMAPEWIAVDEITTEKDCESIIHAGWCGVKLLATAHAANILDLTSRPIYRPLVETKLFTNIILLDRDKSWKLERVVL